MAALLLCGWLNTGCLHGERLPLLTERENPPPPSEGVESRLLLPSRSGNWSGRAMLSVALQFTSRPCPVQTEPLGVCRSVF